MIHFINIVDDDEAVRSSLYTLLATRKNLMIRLFKSGDEFLAAFDELEGGVVLLDIHMPGASGLDVLRIMREDNRGFAAIVITGQGDIGMAVQAMKLGAFDFIEKPYDHVTLFGAIDACTARLGRESASVERARAARERIRSLSDRELETLLLLIDGKANKQVALALNVSPRTVEVHRANLMAKLDVGSLPEAVRLAFAAGIIKED